MSVFKPNHVVPHYRHLAARWWVEGRGSHGLRCECLPCADLRASLGLEGRPLFPDGLKITRVSTRCNDG